MRLFLILLISFSSLRTLAQTDYDYIIQGAGPAGLSAAIELAEAGVSRILVVEKRQLSKEDQENYLLESLSNKKSKNLWGTRKRVIALDKRALERLKILGVQIPFVPIEGFHLHSERQDSIYFPFSGLAGFGLEKYIARDFAASTSIADVEKGLLEKARSYEQIDFLFGAENKVNGTNLKVSNENAELNFESQQIIISSGASSNKTKSSSSEEKHWVVGNFYSPKASRGHEDLGYHLALDIKLRGRKIFQLALDSGKDYVTVYASDSKEIENPRRTILDIARNLKIKGQLRDEVQVFTSTTQKNLETNENIFYIGDSLFTHDPTTGAGVSFAIRNAHILAQSLDEENLVNEDIYRENLEPLESEWRFLTDRFSTVRKHLNAVGGFFHRLSSILSKKPKKNLHQVKLQTHQCRLILN